MDYYILLGVICWYVFAYFAVRATITVCPNSIFTQEPWAALMLWVFSPLPPLCLMLIVIAIAWFTHPLASPVGAALERIGKFLFPGSGS